MGAKLFAAVASLALAAVATPLQANGPIRLVEAWAAAPVDPHLPMRITPTSAAQAQDANYIEIANQLGNQMADYGFNVVGKEREPDVVILVDYIAYVRPINSYYDSATALPSYRALVVTAIDAHAPHGPNDVPKVLWQTVVDSYGVSAQVHQVIPQLVRYGARYYGKALTPQGLGPARWCADGALMYGSHIKVNCPQHPGPAPVPPPSPPIAVG
jgi:hypothetical protein